MLLSPTLTNNEFSNADTYTFVRFILVCEMCAGSTCVAHAAAEHLLLSVATKEFAAPYPNFDKRESFATHAVAGTSFCP